MSSSNALQTCFLGSKASNPPLLRSEELLRGELPLELISSEGGAKKRGGGRGIGGIGVVAYLVPTTRRNTGSKTKTMVKKMWAMAHGLWCVSTNAMARGLRCGVASVTARGAQCCSFEEARRLRSTWLPIIRGGASHRDEKWMFKRIACVAGAGFLFLGWQLDRACHCEQGSVPWRTALPPLASTKHRDAYLAAARASTAPATDGRYGGGLREEE